MLWLWISLSIIAFILLLIFIASLYCFKMIFYSPKRTLPGPSEYELPPGDEFLPFENQMIEWVKKVRAMKHKDFSIKSDDGLTLKGKYYEHKKGAPIEIMFHGYKGYGERDLSGGVERAFNVGHNTLIVDHRASGESDGNVITFGIKERLDCLKWINFVINQFGDNVKIILTGISMGAATVMMVANEKLPKNVKYILADCGYTSPKEIICKVIKDMKLPAKLVFPFVKIGAKLFGRFNIEEFSAIEAVKNANVPIIFFHGDNDNFVPSNMSLELYNVCSSNKKLHIIPGAGHGLAYPVDKETYLKALREFENII